MELITQGAEARVFKSLWLGQNVIIKERFSKKYRHPDLDKHITKERIKGEVRTLVRCHGVGIKAPTLYDVDYEKGVIIMQYIDNSITVRSYLCKEKTNENLMHLAQKIGKTIAKLHMHDIIHGDLTTSNMLLCEPYESSDLCLIDFGLSYVDERCEDKAVDLYVLERAILSTHPNSEEFVEEILKNYESFDSNLKTVIKKLDEVRTRGRKKLCFG